MSKSIARVERAAADAGLEITVLVMDEFTKTASEAARKCVCSVAQIVKSLIFVGENSGRLYLFLVSGVHMLDLAVAEELAGEKLARADPRLVRERTGFAIGGVAPIGHLVEIDAFADESLLDHDVVWAAAGTPNAVFSAEPKRLIAAAGARTVRVAAQA